MSSWTPPPIGEGPVQVSVSGWQPPPLDPLCAENSAPWSPPPLTSTTAESPREPDRAASPHQRFVLIAGAVAGGLLFLGVATFFGYPVLRERFLRPKPPMDMVLRHVNAEIGKQLPWLFKTGAPTISVTHVKRGAVKVHVETALTLKENLLNPVDSNLTALKAGDEPGAFAQASREAYELGGDAAYQALRPSLPRLFQVATAAGDTRPLSFDFNAVKTRKQWILQPIPPHAVSSALVDYRGTPTSQITGNILLAGTPEATKAVGEYVEARKAYVQKVRRAIVEREERRAQQIADGKARFAPGKAYRGNITSLFGTGVPVLVQFEASPGGLSDFAGTFALGTKPEVQKRFAGRFQVTTNRADTVVSARLDTLYATGIKPHRSVPQQFNAGRSDEIVLSAVTDGLSGHWGQGELRLQSAVDLTQFPEPIEEIVAAKPKQEPPVLSPQVTNVPNASTPAMAKPIESPNERSNTPLFRALGTIGLKKATEAPPASPPQTNAPSVVPTLRPMAIVKECQRPPKPGEALVSTLLGEVFEKKYKGKEVSYTGVVDKVRPKDNMVVFQSNGTLYEKTRVEAVIEVSQSAALTGLSQGKTVKVVGTISALRIPAMEIGGQLFGPSRTIHLIDARIEPDR